MTTRSHIALLSLASLVLFAMVPAASAGYPAGSIVGKGDYDYTPTPSDKSSKISLCYVDLDGDAAYDMGEPVYLDTDSTTCNGRVSPKDVRLLATSGDDAGKEVKMTDADRGHPFAGQLTHALRFYDAAGSGEMDDDNTLYIDVMNLANGRVHVGDIRVTANGDLPALSVVQSGDADVNDVLVDIFGTAPTVNTANAVYKAASAYYVNADGDDVSQAKNAFVEDGDVRLSDKAKSVPTAEVELVAPTLEVTALVGPAADVVPGTGFQVAATVKSAGDQPGSGLVKTLVEGTVVDTRGTPTLEPGEAVQIVLTLWAPLGSGSFTVDVLGSTLEVSRSTESRGDAAAHLDAAAGGDSDASASGAGRSGETHAGSITEAPTLGALLSVVSLAGYLVFARRMGD